MALDFYLISDKKRNVRLYSLNEEDYSALSNIFTQLEKKTGVSVDLYADCRLYRDHMVIISNLIDSQVMTNEINGTPIIRFKNFLDEQIAANHDLLIVGD